MTLSHHHHHINVLCYFCFMILAGALAGLVGPFSFCCKCLFCFVLVAVVMALALLAHARHGLAITIVAHVPRAWIFGVVGSSNGGSSGG